MTDSFPENQTINLHDLATIVLRAYELSDPNLSRSQLVEIVEAHDAPQTLPLSAFPPEWHMPSESKVAYILRDPPDDVNAPPVDLESFVHPEAIGAALHQLNRAHKEDIYWRIRLYDNGFVLCYVMQQVLLSLPPSTTILARTSKGKEFTFPPILATVQIAEQRIIAKKAALTMNYCPQPELGPSKVRLGSHLSGFDYTPWPYLSLGYATSVNPEQDSRVVLDIATLQLGVRGAGGELFALESIADYQDHVMSKLAEVEGPIKLSQLVALSDPVLKTRGDRLVKEVQKRLRKIVCDGENNWCRYCGKEDVSQRCSKCKTAHFCKDCQALGWKYHKVWCR